LTRLVDRGPQSPLSHLYLHVPYCRERCTYCAFATTLDKQEEHDELVSALLAELDRHELDGPLVTLYVGGGTPGLLSGECLDRLLRGIALRVPLSPEAEITLEVNPLNVAPATLQAWQDVGITRLSIGVQTFVAETLRQLARLHSGDEARAALELVASTWPTSWSADLLVGWKDQTEAQVEADTRQLLHFAPPHVSVYGLTVEAGTTLHQLQAQGQQVTAEPERLPGFDDIWAGLIHAAGMERYEVSNFARPGHASRHNAAYWRNDAYLGLGPGASSSLGELRWSNNPDVQGYLAGLRDGSSVRQRVERLGPDDRLIECMAVGLRTRSGISLSDLDRRFSPAWRSVILDALGPLRDQGLIEINESTIRIPSNKLVLADNIISSWVRDL
jgi:oxygen-independent coproporphyrinogen-3 oxidase